MTMLSIGFIGLGLMGKPMARNLLRAGFPLTVYNRSRAAIDELAQFGARAANSPTEVAASSEIVITMLPDSVTVEQVVSNLFERARRGTIIIDMGTTHPRVARKLAIDAEQRGLQFLDAPVSGGVGGAQNATLSIMVGGTRAAFERALPVFNALGKKVLYIGGAGAGQIAKAANQIVVAINIQAVAEALTLAKNAGVDPAAVREAMLGGFAASRVLEVHGERMLKRDFVPGGRARTHHKDLQIILDLAKESGTRLPFAEMVDEMFVQLIERGLGDEDHSALVKLLES